MDSRVLPIHCKRHFGNAVAQAKQKGSARDSRARSQTADVIQIYAQFAADSRRLLSLPGLPGVAGSPDLCSRSCDSSVLQVREFQADDIARERSGRGSGHYVSPMVTGIR